MRLPFLLSTIFVPIAYAANVLTNRVVPICENGCFCFGSEGNCPAFPKITDSMVPDFRALTLANPMSVACDPFVSAEACVPALEEGEACVVEIIAPEDDSEAKCPSGHSYRLKTVSSLDDAIATKQYITHLGACGTCSSLQDLALMVEYPMLPYKAQQCFFRSSALKKMDAAIQCYEELGFTTSCSATLSYYQKKIIDKNCGYQCAAWGYDGDLGKPSCTDVSGCGSCIESYGIDTRLELVSGRTFANSGYPSQKARQCSEIAPVSIIGGPDVCKEALSENAALDKPTAAPVVPTEQPVSVPPPTVAPVPPTDQPVSVPPPTVAPVPPTDQPVFVPPPTVAPVPPTNPPIFIITATPTDPPTNPPTNPPTSKPPTNPPTSKPPTIDLTVQQCLATAAIEVRMGALAGGDGVVCDCFDAETTGSTNKPRCFASASRSADTECSIGHSSCSTDKDCCSAGVRKCRGGSCRTASGRTGNRSQLRLSGNRGGAARNRSGPMSPLNLRQRRRGLRAA